MKVNEALHIAEKEIGTTEYPPNSNKVKYNTWYYGKEVSGSAYPWCAVFMSWIFRDTNLILKNASCMNIGQWFKNHKQWFTSPEVGDLVFFKFSNGTRWTNHVGLVTAVHGNTIETIEGNTSSTNKGSQDNGGMVARRTRKKGTNIVGYGRPLYERGNMEKVDFYPSYDGSSVQIDEIFRQIGVEEEYIGSWERRTPIAKRQGIDNYRGTGSQNTILCDLARRGQLKRI